MTTRRDLLASLPLLAIAEALQLHAQTTPPASSPLQTDYTHGQVFHTDVPLKPSSYGAGAAVAEGTLYNGQRLQIHVTELDPGQMPHPPHTHKHCEAMVILAGQLTWMPGEQKLPAGPGDILYAASNELHGLKNTGTAKARYIVFEIGNN